MSEMYNRIDKLCQDKGIRTPVKRLKPFVLCGVFDFMTSFHD